jgi:thymidine kinase
MQSGHIELILGPMFAGKTTELQRRIKRYQHANQRCLIVKFAGDNRYTDEEVTCTHDGAKLHSKEGSIKTIAASTLGQLQDMMSPFSVVAIDEGQFFPDVVEVSDALANSGKIVVVSALDGTFERRPFNNILNLIPMAESVHKITAVCKVCFRDAHFSKRITADTRVEVIGGSDMYIPVCRDCYHAPYSSSPFSPTATGAQSPVPMTASPRTPSTLVRVSAHVKGGMQADSEPFQVGALCISGSED